MVRCHAAGTHQSPIRIKACGLLRDGAVPQPVAQPDAFTLADIAAQVPAASLQPIKKVLASLKKGGRVQVVGRGRGAFWRVVR